MTSVLRDRVRALDDPERHLDAGLEAVAAVSDRAPGKPSPPRPRRCSPRSARGACRRAGRARPRSGFRAGRLRRDWRSAAALGPSRSPASRELRRRQEDEVGNFDPGYPLLAHRLLRAGPEEVVVDDVARNEALGLLGERCAGRRARRRPGRPGRSPASSPARPLARSCMASTRLSCSSRSGPGRIELLGLRDELSLLAAKTVESLLEVAEVDSRAARSWRGARRRSDPTSSSPPPRSRGSPRRRPVLSLWQLDTQTIRRTTTTTRPTTSAANRSCWGGRPPEGGRRGSRRRRSGFALDFGRLARRRVIEEIELDLFGVATLTGLEHRGFGTGRKPGGGRASLTPASAMPRGLLGKMEDSPGTRKRASGLAKRRRPASRRPRARTLPAAPATRERGLGLRLARPGRAPRARRRPEDRGSGREGRLTGRAGSRGGDAASPPALPPRARVPPGRRSRLRRLRIRSWQDVP